jgi:hypothetical protein
MSSQILLYISSETTTTNVTGIVGTIGETKPLNVQQQEVVLLVITFVYYFSETTSSYIIPTFPVMAGESGFTEIK